MKRMKRHTLYILLILAFTPGSVLAEEVASFEVLKQTTVNLINALVDQGVLTRKKADALIREAERKASASTARPPKTVSAHITSEENGNLELKSDEQLSAVAPAGIGSSRLSGRSKMASNQVRVPYIPEVVKNEIREQIKQEVLSQAKNERWTQPNVLPEWLERVKFEGDLRLRYHLDDFDPNNTLPKDYVAAAASGLTRAADFAATSNGIATGNTTEDRNRFRLRARFGLLVRATDSWSAGFRFATGNTLNRVSTQTSLGADFNKYAILLDRAYLKYDPFNWLSFAGGRMPNPWFSTDLTWDDDLNFDGFAATIKPTVAGYPIRPFLTGGIFPIRAQDPPLQAKGRWLAGVQGGAQWDMTPDTRFKFGLAYYEYYNMEGQVEANNTEPGGTKPSNKYGQYEYNTGLRQKGNTLFRTNALSDSSATIWGLASKFAPLNFTATLDLMQFNPVHVMLTSDLVINTAFDRNEIQQRTGFAVKDGKNFGHMHRLTVGMPKIIRRHDWQLFAVYRYLGSDAVLDAFSGSDFGIGGGAIGLGGTNLKSTMIGGAYGIDRGVSLMVRWFSADSIDSPLVTQKGRYSTDTLHADVMMTY